MNVTLHPLLLVMSLYLRSTEGFPGASHHEKRDSGTIFVCVRLNRLDRQRLVKRVERTRNPREGRGRTESHCLVKQAFVGVLFVYSLKCVPLVTNGDKTW